MSLLMIFVDGFGLGRKEDNPIYAANTPHIDRILGGHFLWGDREIEGERVSLKALDACLGVPGIPQSATGQTTLWTGINAAQALGYHLNAYPNEQLQEIIKEHSIFKQLKDRGKRVTFANAFNSWFEQLLAQGKRRLSASTLCALAAGLTLRRAEDLRQGRAVYQEMTNSLLRDLGEDVPIITPFQAGENLARLALDYDFTLYEFFQTDVRGHKQDWQEAIAVIEQLDGLIGGILSVMENTDEQLICLLTSDHGNIEDFQTKGHTQNRVPALLWSNRDLFKPDWKSIVDVTPALVNYILESDNHG